MEDTGVASPEPLIDVDPVSPAPAADDQKATPAATDETAEAVETPEQQEAKKQSRTQRRFERQKTARIQAETRAQMLEQQLAELKAQQPKHQPDSGEPKRDNFPDYESYLEARADWRADQKVQAALKADREASQRKEQQSKESAGTAKVAQKWVEAEKAFKATTKDYEETVMPYVEEDLGQLSDAARKTILDVGPAMLHYLARNSDDHERIAALPDHLQAAEIGKLELKLSAPAGKKVSDAPPPVKPVGQGRSASNGFNDNMSTAEYREWRKAQGARWAQ